MPRPNMLKRMSSGILDLRWKLPRSNSTSPSVVLSDYQIDILNDCVTLVKSDIFKIEAQIITSLSNLLTISRCFKLALPPSFHYDSFPALDFEDGENLDLRVALNRLGKSCAAELQEMQDVRTKMRFQPSKLGPVSWRPQKVPDSERFIAPPTTFKYPKYHRTRRPELEIELDMLVLKKAEMCVQMEKLERDVEFWADLYEDIKNRKWKRDQETVMCNPNPRRLSMPLSNFDVTSVDFDARPAMTRARSANMLAMIPRKEVPIREMVKRSRTTPEDQEGKRDEKRHDSGVAIDDPVASAANISLPAGGAEMLKKDSGIGGIDDEKTLSSI